MVDSRDAIRHLSSVNLLLKHSLIHFLSLSHHLLHGNAVSLNNFLHGRLPAKDSLLPLGGSVVLALGWTIAEVVGDLREFNLSHDDLVEAYPVELPPQKFLSKWLSRIGGLQQIHKLAVKPLVHLDADHESFRLLLVQLLQGEDLFILEVVEHLVNTRPFDYVWLQMVS